MKGNWIPDNDFLVCRSDCGLDGLVVGSVALRVKETSKHKDTPTKQHTNEREQTASEEETA